MDSSDFDIDDTASYGAACETAIVKAAFATTTTTTTTTAGGNPQATTTSDDASSYEWGEFDADSSAGSSSCSDYNQ